MNITIWSDFVCPFCYIGAKNLEKALETFEHKEEVTIEYKSYQLEPGAQYQPDKTYLEAMVDRKKTTPDNMMNMLSQVTEMAEQAGLTYNLDDAKLTDTFPAHRVSQYAKENDKDYEFYEKLYEAFFTNGELISDADVLARIAGEIGLDETRTREILEDQKEYDKEVVSDIYEAQQIGVQGVPFFVLNNKYAVSGAQPAEVFEQALNQVYAEFKDGPEA